MIKVFSGKWRGLGDNEDGFGMILDFRFREILYQFKGAKLGVFMCIALHSDENGLSFPGYECISKETGYNASTIAEALSDLCKMEIKEKRVLMRYRERDANGKYTGSNRYLIFPSKTELENEDEPDLENPSVGEPHLDFPHLGKPTFGKTQVEVKPEVLKLNQSLSNAPSQNSEHSHTQTKRGDIVDGMLFFSRNRTSEDFIHSQVMEFPPDVQNILSEFVRLWKVDIPVRGRSSKSGAYAQWIGELRTLAVASAEYGISILEAVYQDWEKHPFTVSHPGALTNTVAGKVGQFRAKGIKPANKTSHTLSNEDLSKLHAAIKLQSLSEQQEEHGINR